jgi:hypothetical protein
VRAISQEKIPPRSQTKLRRRDPKVFSSEMRESIRVAQPSSLWGLVGARSILPQPNPTGWKPAPLKPEHQAFSSFAD